MPKLNNWFISINRYPYNIDSSYVIENEYYNIIINNIHEDHNGEIIDESLNLINHPSTPLDKLYYCHDDSNMAYIIYDHGEENGSNHDLNYRTSHLYIISDYKFKKEYDDN